jgi:hypothetical protein
LGVVAKVMVSSCLWLSFVFRSYVAPGENFKAKAWKKICRWLFTQTNFPLDSIKLLVSTPQIALMGEMIVEGKSFLQLLRWLCINEIKIVVVVDSGPKPQLNHCSVCV